MTTRLTARTAPARYRIDIDVGGHSLVADEPPALGGADAGPSPFAHVLAGLAACTGITLRMYAEHKGWADIALSVELDLTVGKDARRVARRVVVTGAPDEAAVARLRDVVERTPVTLALKPGFEIVTELTAA